MLLVSFDESDSLTPYLLATGNLDISAWKGWVHSLSLFFDWEWPAILVLMSSHLFVGVEVSSSAVPMKVKREWLDGDASKYSCLALSGRVLTRKGLLGMLETDTDADVVLSSVSV